jgi:hypothetical protein
MQLVEMDVNDVEGFGHLTYFVQHNHVVGDHISHAWILAQGLVAASNEPRSRDRLFAGKQSDLVPLRHQFLGEVGYDAFGAAVALRRYSLDQ